MSLDRQAKLELKLHAAQKTYWEERLSSGKQRAVIVPGFEIPRAGAVDLILDPKKGTVLCLLQRFDYVVAYKHTVGQIIGSLVHYHQMGEREIREALRVCEGHPDLKEKKGPSLNVLQVSKRLHADQRAGEIIISLVTELPEVPQQARELEASFFPVAEWIQLWLTISGKSKKLCKAVQFFAVDPNTEPSALAELTQAIQPMLKMKS